MTGPEPFLRADGIAVRFGGLLAVTDVSIEADTGEVVGIIGPNGAGKTTLLNTVAGTVPTERGRVHLDGVDVSGWPSHRRARAGLARTFQRLEVFGSMTVRENLAFATEAAAFGPKPWRLLARHRHQQPALVDEVIDVLDLGDIADEVASTLPTGRARVVELGRALCARPTLLLLDEPSSGLDATETADLAQRIVQAMQSRRLGVVLVEHDMDLVLGICERLYVLDFGSLIAAGPTTEVARLDRVREAYLGSTHAG